MELEEKYSAIEMEYRDKVYGIIEKLEPGKPYSISEKIRPENHKKFRTVVAYFIKWDEGRHLGNYYITFSNDYSHIKKINYWPAG